MRENTPDSPVDTTADLAAASPEHPEALAEQAPSAAEAVPSQDPRLVGENWRITPLTSRVVRLEWSPEGRFEDRPSTFALHRDLPRPDYEVGESGDRLTVTTEHFHLEYDRGPFSTNGLRLDVRGGVSNWHSVWRFEQDLDVPANVQARRRGEPLGWDSDNLGGSARTLDVADGAIPLEDGVNGRTGYAMIDDSGSMVVDPETGRLTARGAVEGSHDLYVVAGGLDHVATIRDFFAISGPQPIIPRWALGNWWSRYHAYSADEYLQLMDRFAAEDLPFSVSVIDMDWHVTEVDPKYGSGWTGYTWNRDLFPDPEAFQQALHDRGLHVTLNLHPFDGVRAFEEPYARMAKALGREADGSPLEFDVTDPQYMDAYFAMLHDLEDEGTDFWWVDWQQGPYSRVPGMDPLWVQNHEHFLDSERRRGEGQGLTFSRYAGPGSHRYPVGFSGDTMISWASLAFQPRFTAAGANIGYGWWSHDIGGHMLGRRDDELAARWVQFGVLSPIMRLHSSNSPFAGKEPWRFGERAETVMGAHLRLRHRLVPYLHAMNRRAHTEGRSLVEPLYFAEQTPDAYRFLDAYLFGSELLVAPVIRPAAPDTLRGAADVYLPAGTWIDLFTGQVYEGGRALQLHRDLGTVPVLVRAGGVVPLVAEGEDLDAALTPEHLEVVVAAGASGAFDLWEEANADAPGSGADRADGWTCTRFALDAGAGELTIALPGAAPVAGERTFTLSLLGFDAAAFSDLEADGADAAVIAPPVRTAADGPRRPSADAPAPDALRIELTAVTGTSTGTGTAIRLRSRGFTTLVTRTDSHAATRLQRIEDLLNDAQIGNDAKDTIFRLVSEQGEGALAALSGVGVAPLAFEGIAHEFNRPSPALIAAMTEILQS
ncbi:glycoside hydrolase [Brachybacterium sp. JHP9]|uniref:Glycoside hydrolase n=1 Tax=Brachybacterium equifaecis TaxID=2910770 RepID=A0ABT0QZ63_9MICO|nr:glycoside hydrolase family 31 protein [Brachybacterium equifaecis]MCL6422508.1 glycoside hydrolase [Brachybacterium equifaecis]